MKKQEAVVPVSVVTDIVLKQQRKAGNMEMVDLYMRVAHITLVGNRELNGLGDMLIAILLAPGPVT